MQVDFIDLKSQHSEIEEEISAAVGDVFRSAAFSGGPFVSAFEAEFARECGSRFCVAVNSGTSALHITLTALGIGPGDEVIVPANTFFATPESVSLCGATPVFVDCDAAYSIDADQIEAAVTPRTRALIPVHLYGTPVDMGPLMTIASRYGLKVVEDCAQAHGASFRGKKIGTSGIAGCFSFYPSKNLGCCGEGGAVITGDSDLYEKMRALRDHGSTEKYRHEMIGFNYRMDGLQAAVLSVKLRHLAEWTDRRRKIAAVYFEQLSGLPGLSLPVISGNAKPVFHLFPIRTPQRDALRDFLAGKKISTGIHYPVPCHRQKAYEHLGYLPGSLLTCETWAEELLSLPMNEQITGDQAVYVCESVREFFCR